ncbi:nucleic-acid-binding protein from transposon X-element [Trichonephila clavipes]|nr:nucleic-acid-binding protein from transposon X-element [Trichonephila clavipes]
MKITKTYREQVDTVKKYFPHLRLKTTGDYIKLYSNTTEQNRVVRQTLIGLGYKFYVITPKNERPIKVVIKGYPKTADPDHIKSDLEKEGFLPDRVTQLIGRRTKQKLPVFQVTLPRSMENLKIFDLKTLAHLNITVDGYNGKGITQCFSCNNFHHSAENCFLKPRCLKCGEEHLTKDCPIKQRLETKYCINCQVYGHMANWYGCPCFPKPKKGAAKINRNSYTNLYNSFVRPNFSYAQVAKNSDNTKTNSNSQNKPQMAPRRPETSNQTEASINVPPLLKQVQNSNQAFNSNPTPNINLNTTQNGNNSDIKALLSTTVQCLIQLLNAMNTVPTIANSLNQVNSAQADANLMYGLIEASCNTNNDNEVQERLHSIQYFLDDKNLCSNCDNENIDTMECEDCMIIMEELQNIADDTDRNGIQFVKTTDLEVLKKYGIKITPALVYYENQVPSIYEVGYLKKLNINFTPTDWLAPVSLQTAPIASNEDIVNVLGEMPVKDIDFVLNAVK